jgi:AbrB family looped-hinge helix DNA binding protein
MRVTIKGQVTIPRDVREKLGIVPNCEIDFKEEKDRVYLVRKTGKSTKRKSKIKRFRGAATIKMTTDEILALTRG